MSGTSAIGCISDCDPQPLLIRSKLGDYAICSVGIINNENELVAEYLAKKGHFEMMTTLDSTRVVKNIGNLMDEVINHLMQVEGANVEIKLLVEATMPGGTPVTTVRTVTENCKTLKVESFGFDE